jgi:hypothetical protein
MQILNTPPKPFSWSFSAVDNFHTCAKLYYHRNIAKDVSDDTTYRAEGQAVHDVLAKRLLAARPLPSHIKHWERWIDEFLADCDRTRVVLRAEQQLAFTDNFEPCNYFDKVNPPWCRTVVDALKVSGSRALLWDWKTGRIKPNIDQLMLCATAVFVHYPDVKEIDAGLIFLKEDTGPHVPRNDCTHEIRITRADLKPFWQRYIHKVSALEHAIRTNNFQPNPSGLCRNHCPVHSCPHNGHYQ